uniref:NADH-ubiquinone oxidoreductase chain 3 n=1 Tax=Dendropoma gregarium TaxID=169306 RepID=E2FLR6_9CAEN|nr:NADH dehydrogenase subunit 3 [Dendropoma gregarium]ADI79382.1 NADH dehydrogenase subunit 3 [Dendropoma gregarium]
MMGVLLSGLVAFLLAIIVSLIGFSIALCFAGDREKNSAFECGFDPYSSARLPFSLRFFLLAIVFLIFDVEIVLLFPILAAIGMGFTFRVLLTGSIFLVIVLGGLLLEWWEGALDWL